MLVSYSHKFIFIHIPKTAGSSVTGALKSVAHRPREYLVNRLLETIGISVNHFGPHPWKRFRQHETAAVVKKRLPAEIYESFFKCAFVRNPWDQMVSYYHWIIQTPGHSRYKHVRQLCFDEYVRYEVKRGKFSQKSFITDRDGQLIVDFVGRFERLAEDFAYIRDVVQLDADLPHFKKSTRGDYRKYYTPATMDLVANHFHEDIELLGYTFHGGSTEQFRREMMRPAI